MPKKDKNSKKNSLLGKIFNEEFIDIKKYRNTEYDIDPIFINRWSPRAMNGERINEQELMSLFEAAKWAPSSSNNQPWRFLYARRNKPEWEIFFDLLTDSNKRWCKNASDLIVVVSKKTFDNGKFSRTHSYSTGAAWENLALQGTIKGLVIHGMAGFDYEKAREVLEIPDGYDIEAMIAIGKPGKKNQLPKDLQDREKPSDRKKLSEIVCEGKFKW
jgi:nitroreductase